MSVLESSWDRTEAMLEWFEKRIITVFGGGEPKEQMATSFFLLVVFWVSASVTLGLTIFAALVFTFTFWWGVYRLIWGE